VYFIVKKISSAVYKYEQPVIMSGISSAVYKYEQPVIMSGYIPCEFCKLQAETLHKRIRKGHCNLCFLHITSYHPVCHL